MSAPSPTEYAEILGFVAKETEAYVGGLLDRRVRGADPDAAAETFAGTLPEEGEGALAPLRELVDRGFDAAIHSAGPRFFHFVNGGTTPAGLGADWLTSALDQNLGMWVSSPLGSALESLSLAWLRDLFGLPAGWSGVLTSGATMANFSALAAARRWWGERQDVDVDERGLSGLPPMPVLTSGYVHSSAIKALGLLGIGREQVRRLTRDAAGRLDLDALEAALRELGGAPAIVHANAGEVNAGDFDPIDAMADLAERHGAWLHVDGAFGLFAAVSPRTQRLVRGVERASSVISDGHKWLNLPYDCGFAFVRDERYLAGAFAVGAAYLPSTEDPRPNYSYLGPEGSRRGRAIPLWATLRAYGRSGVRAIVERSLDLAQRIAARVDGAPDLERLADVPLNIVCFRFHPPGLEDEERLNELNRRLGEAVLADGRVFVGTTVYEGKVAFRPALVNWSTREQDVDLLVDVIRELGASLRA